MADAELRASEDVRTGLIRGNTFNYQAVQYSVIDEDAIFEGDIVLDTAEAVEQETAEIIEESRRLGAVALVGDRYRWPEATIPYTVDPGLPDVGRVHEAIRHFNERTNIWLKQRSDEYNYVTFRRGNGCKSNIGMRGGRQYIDLGNRCHTGNVIHEIAHAVGLWHEQSREDRDLFVRILWENIDPTQIHNFNQHITDGDDLGPYDYDSIMHYPAVAFPKRDRLLTLEARSGVPIGQRNGLSSGDIGAINTIYPIPAPTKPQTFDI